MLIKIKQIRIQKGRRKVGDVTELANSIKEVGLLNPVTVVPTFDPETFDPTFDLVAGLHRIEAHIFLGLTEIEANILPLQELDRELAELDENLIRNELTVLERAEQLRRRKQLYEAKYPQTVKGQAQALGMNRTLNKFNVNDNLSPTFTQDTANRTNQSARTIEREIQIANRIPENVRDIIRETPLADKKTELLLLTQFDQTTQSQVAEMFAENKIETVKAGLQIIAKKPLPEGFKSRQEISQEVKNTAGCKWVDSLYFASKELNSIKKLGGISSLTAKWADEHKKQYAENCREYAQTFLGYAEEIEKTL